MKTLLLILSILFFLSCEKEEIETGHTMKYIINCSTKDFEIKLTDYGKCTPIEFDSLYVNHLGKEIANTTINEMHWGCEFQSLGGSFLMVLAKAKTKEATMSMKIYHNDSIIFDHTITGDNYPYLAYGIYVPE